MLTITIKANVPAADVQGIKERIAMDIERYGDCKVVRITSDRGREEQLKMGDIGHRDPTGPRGPIGRSSAGAVWTDKPYIESLICELRRAASRSNLIQTDDDGNKYYPVDSYAAMQAAAALEECLKRNNSCK